MIRSPLKRKTPMPRATRWGIKPKPRRQTKRHDSLYRAFVRSLPCCVCHTTRNVEASHVSLGPNDKGVGLKSHDRQCVPHCGGPRGCHGQWEERRGFCKGWSKEARWERAREWVAATQPLATPETLEQAWDLQIAGLGHIVADGFGAWAWMPGPFEEAA